MEVSSFTGSAELGIMNDPFFFEQWPAVNSFNDLGNCLPPVSSAFVEDVHHSSYNYSQQQEVLSFNKRPAEELSQCIKANSPLKHLKTEIKYSNSIPPKKIVKHEQKTWSLSSTLSFPSESFLNNKTTSHRATTNIATSTRFACQSQDHILSERKRREKLSQRFVALSTLVPGMKKTDKASVLCDAVEYMKKLREKVKILEEQSNKKTMESVVFVNGSDESNSLMTTETLVPQVEARFCNNDILVHIHCEKSKGVLEKIVLEIEKLHSSVVNSSVMTFGDSALDITVIAQKDEESTLKINEFAKKLREALKLYM